ncbi:Rab GTPase-binding exocyst subunit S15 [Savitreella phatthalungensis]
MVAPSGPAKASGASRLQTNTTAITTAATTATGLSLASQVQQIVANSRTDNENLEQLAPVIRNACLSAQEESLLSELENVAVAKKREIESICADNKADFLGSVGHLLKVRQSTVSLRQQVAELNHAMQDSGTELTKRKKGLLESKAVSRNIGEAIGTLQRCVKLLNATNRIQEFVDGGNFYAALRGLDELQRVQLREVPQHDFVLLIKGSIPTIKRSIQDAVRQKLKTWLYDIREQSRAVGQAAIRETERRQARWRAQIEKNPSLQPFKLNSPIELVLNDEDDFDPLDNDDVRIDFTTFFECVHIFDEMGTLGELKQQYASDRRTQKDLLIPASLRLSDASSAQQQLERLLQDITGFAIIEHFTGRKAREFRQPEEVEAIWSSLTAVVVERVGAALRAVDDAASLLEMRNQLMTFTLTLESLEFDMTNLNKFMLELLEIYSSLLGRQFEASFNENADKDNYLPMSVENEEDWEKIAAYCWYSEPPRPEGLPTPTYPRAFPFSQTYPLCCIEIRDYINEFYACADDLSNKHDEVEEILRRSLEHLLVRCVNQNLSARLPLLQLSQLSQMIVNLEQFEGACSELNKILNESRSSRKSKLLASEQFSVTQEACEKRIFELVDRKIDAVFELAEYDWGTSGPARAAPAPWVEELCSFLTATMRDQLANLPERVTTMVRFDALDRVASRMTQIPLAEGPATRRISIAGAQNFERDVRHLESFIADPRAFSGSRPSTRDAADRTSDDGPQSAADMLAAQSALDLLVEVRQVCNFLLADDPGAEYLDTAVRNRKYARVRPAVAIKLLEKLLAAVSSNDGSSSALGSASAAVGDALGGFMSGGGLPAGMDPAKRARKLKLETGLAQLQASLGRR